MIEHITIDVARDFRPDLGYRYRTDGPGSGEEFREDVLLPAFEKAESVTVDLGGVAGVGGGWITEAFGGLVRELGSGAFGRIRFVSESHPGRVERARVAMSDAADRLKDSPEIEPRIEIAVSQQSDNGSAKERE